MRELTTPEYFQFIEQLHEEMLALIKTKNNDYSGGGGPFANFKEAENFGVDPLVGLSVRIGDKIKRLQTYCQTGDLAVKGEGVEDIFKDLIGYSWLALGMLHEKKQAPTIPHAIEYNGPHGVLNGGKL